MDLTSVYQLGKVVKEKEIVKGLVVKIHTLSAAEQSEALEATTDGDITKKVDQYQRAILSKAIDTINGQLIPDKGAFFTGIQGKILQEIYKAYNEMTAEQDKIIEALKKK